MCRRLMALPLLPAEHIPSAFRHLHNAMPSNVDDRLHRLVAHVDETWVSSRLWPASSWSAFQSSIRTNNDVEGWHNRLNQQARRGKLDLYQLATLLFREADFVSVQCVLVSECRLRRDHRKRYNRVQGRLDKYWTAYSAGELTTSALLKNCSYVYGPAR